MLARTGPALPGPPGDGSTPHPSRQRVRRPLVLLYHGFSETARDDDPENLFVTAERLDEQLTWLLARGWRPLDLDGYLRLRSGRATPEERGRSFLLTIDDGFASVLHLALPVLERHRVPALLYVPSGLVGATARWLPRPADEPLLDRDELVEVLASPYVEAGLHGSDHQGLYGAPSDVLDTQVHRAHDELGSLLGHRVRSFAYPFGAHDAAARAAVAAEGFDVAFSVYDDVGAMAVSRVDVNATDTLASFRLKVQLPHYRRWWNALERAPVVRRQVRALATRARGSGR